MRAIDQDECRASGHTPKGALRHSLMNSSKAWTALVDDQPEAMFGVVVTSALTGEGVPWFLGTDEVYRHGRALMTWGPGLLSRMHDSSPTLRNVVSSANGRAIRLLERWGFNVAREEQMIGGMAMRAFESAV